MGHPEKMENCMWYCYYQSWGRVFPDGQGALVKCNLDMLKGPGEGERETLAVVSAPGS